MTTPRSLLLAGVALILSLTVCPAAGLLLADKGLSTYSIVIAPDASPTVKHAAQELADDLKVITGAVLPVVSSKPAGPAIFVGPSPFLPATFAKVRLENMPPEAFVVRTDHHDLFLHHLGFVCDGDRGNAVVRPTVCELGAGKYLQRGGHAPRQPGWKTRG